MENKLIKLFQFKKIEQGQLLYPKFFPLFSQDISHKDFQNLKFAQVQLNSQASGRKMELLNLRKEEEETVKREK